MTRVGSARGLAFILVNVVFASSMLVTNDVALITFVPLALALFMHASPRATIATVVALTVAANLGSMCTPIGNPQNIYLVSAFNMGLDDFFATVLPIGALSYLCIYARVPRAETGRYLLCFSLVNAILLVLMLAIAVPST